MLHYLDYAATTPVPRAVAEAMVEALTEGFGNPSSQYDLGRSAKAALEAHRRTIAAALGCPPERLFFTSCGTEGDNWAIRAALWQNRRLGKHIITTAVEHSAVLQCMKDLEQQGYTVTYLKPDGQNRITASQVAEALRPDTALVSMMLVNNETGVVLPVADCVKAVKAFDPAILFHCDAVQGFLKLAYTPVSTGADLITVSGHKVGGPKGVGALYIRKGVRLAPLLTGGGQEEGLRSGTEATAQIAGFAAACQAVMADLGRLERTAAIKAYTLEQLKQAVPKLEVISPGDAPHICAVTLPGYPSEVLVRVLGDQGICISSGSACHRGKPSHVFAAMGLPKPWLSGALRLSFSPKTAQEEADRLVEALQQTSERVFPIMS